MLRKIVLKLEISNRFRKYRTMQKSNNEKFRKMKKITNEVGMFSLPTSSQKNTLRLLLIMNAHP